MYNTYKTDYLNAAYFIRYSLAENANENLNMA